MCFSQIKHILNHELMQFTIGKTDKSLNYILSHYISSNDDDDKKQITIVVTNKSLAETAQWKYRIKKKFMNNNEINIKVLSSKRPKDNNEKKNHHKK